MFNRQNFFRILIVMLAAVSMRADLNHYVVTGSGDNPGMIPTCASTYKYSWSSMLLTNEEVGAEKTITHLSFYGMYNIGDVALENQKIYLSHVDYTSFPTGDQSWNYAYLDPTNDPNFVQVFDGTLNYTEGWIDLDIEDFEYNGTDNLVIHFESEHNVQNYSIKFRSRENTSTEVRAIRNGGDVVIPTTAGFQDYPASFVDVKISFDSDGPNTPSEPMPASGATLVSVSTSLDFTLDESASTYSIMLGKDGEEMVEVATDVTAISGANSYTHEGGFDPNSTYFWRVDAKGATGELTEGVRWSFTTETIINEFPYTEGFEDNAGGYFSDPFPPTGWNKNYSEYYGWIPHDDESWSNDYLNAHTGTVSAYVKPSSITQEEGDALLETPKFLLPANPRISFWWCDNAYVTSQNPPADIADSDVTYFEISDDNGATWTIIDSLSSPEPMEAYEKSTNVVPQYANKAVTMRWRYKLLNETGAMNTFIDDIEVVNIEGTQGELSFLTDSLKFGTTYEGFVLEQPLVVENIGSLAVDVSESIIAAPFSCDFTGTLEPGVKDTLTIFFSPETDGVFEEELKLVNNGVNGELTIPVTGTSLAKFTAITEDFEGEEAVLPEHWSTIVVNDHSQSFLSSIMVSPFAVDAHSGTHSIKMLVAYDVDADLVLVTPPVKDTETSMVEFWAKAGQFQERELTLGYINGNDLESFEAIETYTLGEEYTKYTKNLAGITPKNNLAFKFVNTGDQLISLFIDDVIYGPAGIITPDPTTPVAPLDGAEGVFLGSELEWNIPAGSPDGYRLYLGSDAAATNIVDGEVYDDPAEVTFELEGLLDYGTEYFWKVIPFNASGDASPIETWSFTTVDEVVISSFPWEENFDSYNNATFPYEGGWNYETYSAYEFFIWNVFHNNDNHPNMAHSAPAYIHYPTWLSYQADTYLFSPAIEMTEGITYELSFWQKSPDTAGTNSYESIEVFWGDAPTKDSMFPTPLYSEVELTERDYQLITLEVTPTETKKYYFSFHVFSPSQQDMYVLDDVSVTVSSSIEETVPEKFTVHQNYPNPFNPETTINFDLPQDGFVKVQIFNQSGQLVKTLLNKEMKAGYGHKIMWDGKDYNSSLVSSGVYFYLTELSGTKIVKKMVLTK